VSNMRETAQDEIRAAEKQIEVLKTQVKDLRADVGRAKKVLKLYPEETATTPTPIARVS